MKKLCTKNKGKVYPSPSSSSSSSSSSQSLNPDSVLSVLSFLPATILALATILSGEDREVLAYLITRSLKTTDPSSLIEEKKKCKKPNTPNFECGCFECYTGYWFRWDSSPNRELIHQVIEAFEDHLTNGEKPFKRGSCNKGRRREKVFDKTPTKKKEPEKQLVLVPDDEAEEEEVVVAAADKFQGLEEVEVESVVERVQVLAVSEQHKGLGRKVLPDVMGIFNSRLWSLWSTNI